MDKTGLLYNIYEAVVRIDSGRKGFATRGKEQEGRINYEIGITQVLSAFQEALNQRFAKSADPQTIILAEYNFLTQELEFCEKTDNDSLTSLTKAIQSFDDAFLALEVVEDKFLYQGVEKVIPHSGKHSFKGFPMDAFHITCKGHITRLRNILKTSGLDPIEKFLLKQRLVNLSAGHSGYVKKQKKVLVN